MRQGQDEGRGDTLRVPLVSQDRDVDDENDKGEEGTSSTTPTAITVRVRPSSDNRRRPLVEARDQMSCTCLHYACYSGATEALKVCLQRGRPTIASNFVT